MKKLLLYLLFSFSAINAGAQTISIIGSSSPSVNWTTDVDLTTTDNITYTLNNVTLTTATDPGSTGLKFRQDHSWTNNWGSAAFPTGTGVLGGANIMTLAGTYDITFNRITGNYSFVGTVAVIPTVAIVGTAVGGWPVDPQTDGNQLPTSDGITYNSNSVQLTAGEFKFRQDNSWANSWGGVSFPSGPVSGSESQNILVTTAGNYRVVFNRNTGAYNFDFPGIAIVGEAVGGWPGDPGNPGPTDVHQMTTTNGETYTINNLEITTAITGGGVKFRQDNSWTISWGFNSFPSASSSDGSNIPTVAGTYDVTFTRSTGAFSFTPSLANADLTKLTVTVYPNPTQNLWSFTSNAESINCVALYDMLGKKVIQLKPNSLEVTIDSVNLNRGIYLAKIETDSSSQTVKLIKE